MRGTKLIITTLIAATFGLVIILFVVSGGNLASWSISDGTNFEPFLDLILMAIILLLWTISFHHNHASKIMFVGRFPYVVSWWPFKIIRQRTEITLAVLDRITALLFVGVLAFGMGGAWWSIVMHYIFIILASFGMFIRVTRYYKTGLLKTLSMIGMVLGIGAWVIGFLSPRLGFDLWTVFFGEVVFMVVAELSLLTQFNSLVVNSANGAEKKKL